MKIVLYRDESSISNEAVSFLLELGVRFDEVDARTKEGYERLVKRTQQYGIPAFELKRNHSIEIIVGLDKGLLRRELSGQMK
jgi:hypothetical protein